MKILDCTIRDGGYLNNWKFSDKFVRNTYRVVSDANIDFFEIGFINKPNKNKGKWNSITDKEIKDIFGSYSGCDLGVMINYGKPTLKVPEEVKMVRIATHKNKLFESLKYAEEIKNMGFLVSLQMMGYSTFTDIEQQQAKEKLSSSIIDYAYVADSYGSMFASDIHRLLSPLLEIKSLKIGFHPHNSLQLAFANTLEAMDCGIDIVDASLFGMGRGSGNLQLELLVSYLQLKHKFNYNAEPLLSYIESDIFRFKDKCGYKIPYMLTGLFNCHPYYATLKKGKNTKNIWEHLESVSKGTIGFSQEILDDIVSKDVNLKLTAPMLDSKKKKRIMNNIHIPSSFSKIINLMEKARRLKMYKKYNSYIDMTKEFHNIHKGEKCYIIGTGPSLNKTQFDLIKNETVFGVNTLFRGLQEYNIHPKYYVLGDSDVFHAHHKQLLKLDITMILSGGAGHLYLNNKKYYDGISNSTIIPIKRLGRMSIMSDFSKDITNGVFSSGTVILHCLQLAYYMGFTEVYLLGCDCDYSHSHHFDNRRTIKKEAPVMIDDIGKQRVFKGYSICKRAYEKDNRKIYNATVGGKLEVFERKSLEESVS